MVDKDFRPLSFWSFNEDMRDEEIIRQIHEFKEQGFGGFFMHARAGMTLEYLGEKWMHACKVAVEEAEKLELYAWLYDENGWPSGFAGGLVPALGDEYTAKHLYFVEEYPGEENYLAAYMKISDDEYKKIDGASVKNADMYCCLGYLKGYADLLSHEAMEKFIEFTHERYYKEFGKYFGNVIPGIFTDEPQLVGKFPYTGKYSKIFKDKYGYDFFDKAWMLNIDSDKCSEFKYQASKLVAKLFTKNFTTQIEEWCENHNILFTGHYSNEDGLCNQISANYDLMAQYSIMGRPGIDFLGRRLTSPVLVKQISDVAYLTGKNRITSESFGCCGWDVTFNDLLWIADWEASFGINSIVTHLSAYSIKGRRKRDYPAFFSYQEPWWKIFEEVSHNITETNEFLSEGCRHINILVVHPTTGMWCSVAGKDTFSDRSRYISNQFRMLVENLLNLQRDFLIVSEDELSKFKIKGKKLVRDDIKAEVLIIADTTSLNASTWNLAEKFAEKEGKLIFMNQIPKLSEGKVCEKDIENKVILENRIGLIEKYFLEKGINDEVTVTDGYNGESADGIVLTTKYLKDGTIRVFVINPSRFESRRIFLKAKGDKSIEGRKSMFDGKNTYSEIMLNPTESIRLVVKDAKEVRQKECINQTKAVSKIIVFNEVSTLERNSFTIDKCNVYVNGKQILKDVLPADSADSVYEYAYKIGKTVKIRLEYCFRVDFSGKIPEDFSLVAEDEGLTAVEINGVDVSGNKEGWWIDKSFGQFNIDGFVKDGENIVALEFDIKKHEESDEGEDFEGYRNKFFYSIEPENVYILGNFDVYAEGETFEDVESLYKSGPFTIIKPTDKTYGELTGQGLWFYRGNVSYKGRFTCNKLSKNSKFYIRLPEMNEVAAKVIINKKDAGMILREPYQLDITSLLDEGQNEIQIVLYGNNRNLLGPHHHKMGNPHMLGVPTFLGKKCFTDFIYPELTEDDVSIKEYAFVKFGLNKVVLDEYR